VGFSGPGWVGQPSAFAEGSQLPLPALYPQVRRSQRAGHIPSVVTVCTVAVASACTAVAVVAGLVAVAVAAVAGSERLDA
jgi:hypothetical protein